MSNSPSPPPPAPSSDARELAYVVAGMMCGHCTVAVTLTKVAGVRAVDVDLGSKLVRVHGTDVDEAAVVGVRNGGSLGVAVRPWARRSRERGDLVGFV